MAGPRLYGDLFGGFGNRSASPARTQEQIDEEKLKANEAAKSAGVPEMAGLSQGTIPGQAPIEAPTSTELQQFGGTPDQSGSAWDTNQGDTAESIIDKVMYPYSSSGGPVGPGETIMPEGQNYHPVGGKQPWDYAFTQQPQKIEANIESGAQAEANASASRADFYAKEQQRQQEEAAVLQQRRIENQQLIEQQQNRLQEATKNYTNDLADRGQWWRNPGNIVSAIGLAIVGLGSGDPSLGVKLIGNAVNADYQQRRQLADMHLGELRSNLASYRQIAGDRELGDKLAYAENNRVAAMEVERIGNQFAGPIAKAKASAIAGEFMRNYTIQMMQLRQALGVYNKPQKTTPGILAEYKKAAEADQTGEGWSAYSSALQSHIQAGGVVPPGHGPASTATSKPGSTTGFVSTSKNVIDKPIMSSAQEDLVNKRYPGLVDAAKTARINNVRDAMARSHIDPTRLPDNATDSYISAYIRAQGKDPTVKGGFNEKFEELKMADKKDLVEVSKAMTPHADVISGWRLLGNDMNVLEKTTSILRSQGKIKGGPDELLDTRYSQYFGSGNTKALAEWLSAGTPEGPHEEQAKRLSDAMNRYKQLLSSQIGGYIHEKAGTALSKTELENLHQVISHDHSWNSVRNFQRMSEAARQAEINAILAGVSNKSIKNIWNARLGYGAPQGLVSEGIAGPPATVLQRNDLPLSGENLKGTIQDPEVQRAAASSLFGASQKQRMLGGK